MWNIPRGTLIANLSCMDLHSRLYDYSSKNADDIVLVELRESVRVISLYMLNENSLITKEEFGRRLDFAERILR